MGPIQVAELQEAKRRWMLFVQHQEFATEIKVLSNGGLITKGPLRCLSPFLQDGILRVGGRLQHSDESFERKHPILLPAKNNVTNMIFRAFHLRLLHIGPQGLLAMVRSEFWPLRGRDSARKVVHLCQRCFRARPIPLQQPMGQLPKQRVTPSKPFSFTGVDFAGPMQVKTGLRKIVLVKAYIAVFVCMATKAVHLELVSNLTSEAFLAALRRFISRRGLPSQIWSDNGTNFVGARKELKRYLMNAPNNRSVTDILADDGIQWVFIPPNAPHFGGLWESAVKSCKHHLCRAMTSSHFNFEELATLLTQVEACLNSRPLSALSSDPGDHQALTPGHFLVGGPLLSTPDTDVSEVPLNRLKRWSMVQKAFQLFWKRWKNEYLSSLQGKGKWLQSPTQIKIGTLAVLKEDNSPPLSWRLVRVTAIHPGQDGVVRVVTLRTSGGTELTRPVVKICPLPDSN
jgi:transposase InsO family protein